MARGLGPPAAPVEDPDAFPGPWICLGPPLDVAGIWGMNQGIKDL